MAGDRRTQFNNWLSQDDVIEFKKTLAKKYGIYQNNMQSYEVGLLIKWYNSVGGHIPTNAHTHEHSANQKTKMKTTEGVINIPQPAEGPETEMIAILTKGRGSGGEEYHKLPPQDDPILRQWLLTKGIDITNFDSIASNITEEDIRVREMSESDLIQWKKNIYDRLAAKRRRKDNKKWIMQATERDKQLEPDLRQIKSYLVNTDSIMANNHVDIDQMYKAWSIATGKRDRQRTFRNELHGYIGCGYFTPLDSKYKKFRVEDKLMSL